nr:S-adenosylmethionine:tRNA ribosyltransferase-isomerase [Hymenobacter qilianensis]
MSAFSDPRQLSIQDFTYELPPSRIAPEPLPNRDQSRLLVYRGGQISDQRFHNLPSELPPALCWSSTTRRWCGRGCFARSPRVA